MALDLYKGIPVLGDEPAANDELFPAGASFGHDPAQVVKEMFAPPSEMTLIEESDWDAWYDEQEAQKSSLEHIYLQNGGNPTFVNLDQGNAGYCWAYSTGHAMMIAALRDNSLNYRLNPHSVAAIIKKGRDEGGWCGLSAKWANETGYAEEGDGPGKWPLYSRNLKHDTPELRAAMAKHKTGEEWRDLARDVYDQRLTIKQLATCLFVNQPCPTDFNWWGHSVCSLRWVRIEAGSWGLLILNSWKDWGRHGLAVLRGNKAKPDGALCIRTVGAR
jgi:hypothetical protein